MASGSRTCDSTANCNLGPFTLHESRDKIPERDLFSVAILKVPEGTKEYSIRIINIRNSKTLAQATINLDQLSLPILFSLDIHTLQRESSQKNPVGYEKDVKILTGLLNSETSLSNDEQTAIRHANQVMQRKIMTPSIQVTQRVSSESKTSLKNEIFGLLYETSGEKIPYHFLVQPHTETVYPSDFNDALAPPVESNDEKPELEQRWTRTLVKSEKVPELAYNLLPKNTFSRSIKVNVIIPEGMSQNPNKEIGVSIFESTLKPKISSEKLPVYTPGSIMLAPLNTNRNHMYVNLSLIEEGEKTSTQTYRVKLNELMKGVQELTLKISKEEGKFSPSLSSITQTGVQLPLTSPKKKTPSTNGSVNQSLLESALQEER